MSDKPYDYPDCEADKEIEYLIRSRYAMIYVVTWEEQRVIDSIQRVCEQDAIGITELHVWDSGRGLTRADGSPVPGTEELFTPDAILDHITGKATKEMTLGKKARSSAQRGPLYVLCDMYRYLDPAMEGAPEVERKLRNLASMLKYTSKFVVITSPELKLPTSIEKSVAVVDYPLPGQPQLKACVEAIREVLRDRKRITEAAASEDMEPVVRALMGLTLQEAEDALAKSVVMRDRFDVGVLNDLKRQVIRKGELLEQLFTGETMDDIGGMEGIKQYLALRKGCFSDEARAYGISPPKGIFLLGVQGCGKSLCAKVVANEFQVPLLKLDMGRMFGSLVGESESNCRRALKMAEGVAPCVLFIDELDKAFSGATGAQGDGGVTRRVIGSILDWMQEKKAPVFVVAASNSMDGIPPAVVRKGRFDERFFVDLPGPEERKAIFAIHVRKRGRDPARFDLEALAAGSEAFSGAEIEGVVEDAMKWAFSEGRELETRDVLSECKVCVPLAATMREEVEALRNGVFGRMRMANRPLGSAPPIVARPPDEGGRFENL